ncbi:MAG: RIO1 family regulatory kinase/ATPase [Pseudomonadota bacterium]
MFKSLKLSDFQRKKIRILRKTSSTRPALWVAEEGGVRAVVKDYSGNGFVYRNTVGRFLVWREKRAYQRLEGLKGIPCLYRVIGGLALVIEEIEGSSLEDLEKVKRLSEDFFDRMRSLVERVHQRGLAHCDLKRAPNILLGKDGQPYIIDWCAAISEKEFRACPLNQLYKRFLLDDFNAITKVQLRHCPERVTAEQKRRYAYRNGAEKFVRAVRDRLREILQKVA